MAAVPMPYNARLAATTVVAVVLSGACAVHNEPFVETAIFSTIGSGLERRSSHTATLLRDGSVLIVGGRGGTEGSTFVSTAEVYHNRSGRFTAVGGLVIPRMAHAATVLPDGRVLITGGVAANAAIESSSELYDPVSMSFVLAAPMAARRERHTATLLKNGKVLIVGGVDAFHSMGSAELYDPLTGRFVPTGDLNDSRGLHTATLLNDGRVLIVGGFGGSFRTGAYLATAELYDPATGLFTRTGSLSKPRGAHSATLLPGDEVLVAGGQAHNEVHSSLELFQAGSGAFVPRGNLATMRTLHAAALYQGRAVIIAGGLDVQSNRLSSAERYEVSTGRVLPANEMSTYRFRHVTTSLTDGRVLVTGGQVGEPGPGLAEIYGPR